MAFYNEKGLKDCSLFLSYGILRYIYIGENEEESNL